MRHYSERGRVALKPVTQCLNRVKATERKMRKRLAKGVGILGPSRSASALARFSASQRSEQ